MHPKVHPPHMPVIEIFFVFAKEEKKLEKLHRMV